MKSLTVPIPQRISQLRFVAGFTVLELMITITIIAIGLSLAVPSIRETIANNQVAVANNSIISAINLARSEAITRGNSVVVCPSTTGKKCNNGKWNAGWIVFDNNDADATLATTEIIRVNSRAEAVNRTGYGGIIVFQPDGTTTLNGSKTIKICFAGTAVTKKCRSITISRFGSVKSVETTG